MNILNLRIFGLLSLCLVTIDVHAYLDPGTGSMIIQGLIAAVAMIGITGRLYWHRILVFLGKREAQVEDDLDAEADENPTDQH